MHNTPKHIPVMVDPVMSALAPKKGETHIDGTFGAGGYTKRILEQEASVIAFDRDPDAMERGKDLQEHYGSKLTLVHDTYSTMGEFVENHSRRPIDGIVLDLGVSSPQLDEAHRGFSFQKRGPLDMRMSKEGTTAAEVVNTLSERELSYILKLYGDELKARAIARAIVKRRQEKSFETTEELASVIYSVTGRKKPHQSIDPATKTFQALRIHVNDELGELQKGLEAATHILEPHGRLVVVTFHSLEDRIVKNFIRDRSAQKPRGSRHASCLVSDDASDVIFMDFSKKALVPSDQEIEKNPRSRSAKMRWAIKGEC